MHRAWVFLAGLGVCGAVLGVALGTSRLETTSARAETGVESLQAPGITGYSTMCNASAAVSVGNGLFVVADDEDQKLRLYRIGQAGKPLSHDGIPRDLLNLEGDFPEVDIEGAAELAGRVFWIGSHSASHDGKPRPNRRRLFATKLRVERGDQLKVEKEGKAYQKLIHDLDDHKGYKRFDLPEAGKKQPKAEGALSIEGLASTPEGILLIGFRNPLIGGKALVAPLMNPMGVINGEPGKFAEPILLDLGGLGIRSMERKGDKYYVIAGSYDGNPNFKLFRWSGKSNETPTPVTGVDFTYMNPEALFFEGAEGYILSDDGKMQVGEKTCEMLEKGLRLFRGFGFKP